MLRVELGSNDGELMEGRHDLVAQGCRTYESENRDHYEQQGKDGHKAVPAECNDELIRVVVTELLDDCVNQTNRAAGSLPAVDRYEHASNPLHEQKYSGACPVTEMD